MSSKIASMPTILEVKKICKNFKRDRQQELPVLSNINFDLYPGQIVAFLGKSGSGKSTLLRIIAGLIPASQGEVYYRDQLVNRPVRGIAMVFQQFALMPWLTVLQNVELGLEAQGIKRAERRDRALKAIDTIGLDGFESAYPKELSGGMRQRVGFARALVVEPDILLMDEPFSALDVLTAENLRSDLLDLWLQKKTRTDGIIFVTHNIEEAVMMANRIIIFDSNPGKIHTELVNNIPYPRNENDATFRDMVDEIYTLMTRHHGSQIALQTIQTPDKEIDLSYRLPKVSISELSGLLEILVEPENQGSMDLPELAELLHLNIDDLFPITEMLEILRFAKVSEGDIRLTQAGRNFANAGILDRKKLFSQHLLKYVPIARRVRRLLDETLRHRIPENKILEELEQYLNAENAEQVLTTVIDWGRYAEIFAYDYNSGELSLENPN